MYDIFLKLKLKRFENLNTSQNNVILEKKNCFVDFLWIYDVFVNQFDKK